MYMEHKGISLLDLGPISQNLNIHMQICQNVTQIPPPQLLVASCPSTSDKRFTAWIVLSVV